MEFATAYSSDIRSLSPLRKLQGINLDQWSRPRIPNLAKMEAEFSEDLIYTVEDLLSPGDDDINQSKSW